MGPLAGIRVLDLTHAVAGPVCTMFLGDLGADIVKIEKPGRGDNTRYNNISDRFAKEAVAAGGDYFLAINRNKRSVAVDMKTARGKEIILKLAREADIIVQNFRPGSVQRLGLDYQCIKKINPAIIYASLTGWGNQGPLADKPGMDLAVQSRAGVLAMTGHPGGPPTRPGASVADMSGGVYLALAIQGALIHRMKTGEGQEVSSSLFDGMLSMLANFSVAVMEGGAKLEPVGTGHPQIVPYQAFPTADGYVVIACATNRLFRKLTEVIERPDLLTDPRFKTNIERVDNRDALVVILSEIMKQKTTAQWLALLDAGGVVCAPVNTVQQGFAEPQLAANEMIKTVQHPVYGPLRLLRAPMKLSSTDCEITRHPPLLGQHTNEILAQIGYSQSEIEGLRTDKIVA